MVKKSTSQKVLNISSQMILFISFHSINKYLNNFIDLKYIYYQGSQ
jgi:hypothetical protein